MVPFSIFHEHKSFLNGYSHQVKSIFFLSMLSCGNDNFLQLVNGLGYIIMGIATYFNTQGVWSRGLLHVHTCRAAQHPTPTPFRERFWPSRWFVVAVGWLLWTTSVLLAHVDGPDGSLPELALGWSGCTQEDPCTKLVSLFVTFKID